MCKQKVDSLLHITTLTCPDAAKAATKLSGFLSPWHIKAADRAISYLYETKNLTIQYGPTHGQEAFTRSSDAAFSDNQDRKSSDGYLFSLFGGHIDWKAGRQKTVTTSNTEAAAGLLGLTQVVNKYTSGEDSSTDSEWTYLSCYHRLWLYSRL